MVAPVLNVLPSVTGKVRRTRGPGHVHVERGIHRDRRMQLVAASAQVSGVAQHRINHERFTPVVCPDVESNAIVGKHREVARDRFAGIPILLVDARSFQPNVSRRSFQHQVARIEFQSLRSLKAQLN